jgi:hypothetical protein
MRHVRTLAATTAVANNSPSRHSTHTARIRIEVEALPNLQIQSTGASNFLLAADYSTLTIDMAVLSQARV